MRVLVLGGTRFNGAAAVRRLTSLGHRVLVIHRGHHEAGEDSALHLHAERSELRSLRRQVASFAPDIALDTAAFTHDDARLAASFLRDISPRVVVLSSLDVYQAYECLHRTCAGEPPSAPLDEHAPVRRSRYPRRERATGPDDAEYLYDKVLVEEQYRSVEGLSVTVLRLPFVYGPFDHRDRIGQVLRWIRQSGPRVTVPADRASWRASRAFVDDVVSAIELVMKDSRAEGQTFNVGEQVALTELEWMRLIARAVGWEGELLSDPTATDTRRPAADWRFHLVTDTARLRAIGWSEQRGTAENVTESLARERDGGG